MFINVFIYLVIHSFITHTGNTPKLIQMGETNSNIHLVLHASASRYRGHGDVECTRLHQAFMLAHAANVQEAEEQIAYQRYLDSWRLPTGREFAIPYERNRNGSWKLKPLPLSDLCRNFCADLRRGLPGRGQGPGGIDGVYPLERERQHSHERQPHAERSGKRPRLQPFSRGMVALLAGAQLPRLLPLPRALLMLQSASESTRRSKIVVPSLATWRENWVYDQSLTRESIPRCLQRYIVLTGALNTDLLRPTLHI